MSYCIFRYREGSLGCALVDALDEMVMVNSKFVLGVVSQIFWAQG